MSVYHHQDGRAEFHSRNTSTATSEAQHHSGSFPPDTFADSQYHLPLSFINSSPALPNAGQGTTGNVGAGAQVGPGPSPSSALARQNTFTPPGYNRTFAPQTQSYPQASRFQTHQTPYHVAPFNNATASFKSGSQPQLWDPASRYASSSSVDDIIMGSPSLSDTSFELAGLSMGLMKAKVGHGKGRPQRRPSNRDEFDGPHQFLQPLSPDYIAMQERELPHLPTNLLVQEQDAILSQVNDRLSQCAYDFVAKYQFPIPLTQDMRPVERPQDREWTEWVYLLKRLATKRRIPSRVLYNCQIKQLVTILENSLEMRHAAKHQSRPLKDDRNILQLISAGIQVAKILKDASAMEYLDRLYVSTENTIHERTSGVRFR